MFGEQRSLFLNDYEIKRWTDIVSDPNIQGLFQQNDGKWCVNLRYSADSPQYANYGIRADWNLIGPDILEVPAEVVVALGLDNLGEETQ